MKSTLNNKAFQVHLNSKTLVFNLLAKHGFRSSGTP